MLVLPWKVDVPFERDPVTNWLLIASVVAVFMLEMIWKMDHPYILTPVDPGNTQVQYNPTPFDPFVLHGFSNIRGLFGHMWLHANFLHIFGNMLFLWIFGNAVCQRIGNGLYLPMYLLAGLAAAGAHILFSDEPAIGASGAINGVVGMYVVFYPLNEITCLFTLFPLIPFAYAAGFRLITISSFWMILLWLGFDIYGAAAGGGPVAYCAHLGGFAAGFVLAVLLLLTKRVRMGRYERSLLQILKHEAPVFHRPPPPEMPWKPDGDYVEEEIDMQKYVRPMKLGHFLNSDDTNRQPVAPELSKPSSYIEFTCLCGQRIKTPAANAGRSGMCPACQKVVKVPAKSTSNNE